MICPNTKRRPKKPKVDASGNAVAVKEPEDYSEVYAEIVKEIDTLDTKITY